MTTDREPWLPLTPAPDTTEARPRTRGWSAAEKLAILTEYESYPRGDPRRGPERWQEGSEFLLGVNHKASIYLTKTVKTLKRFGCFQSRLFILFGS